MATSPAELVKSLVDAGVHFGHRVSRWNPKMQPYISGKRNMIHIIDVKETVKGLLRAKKLVQSVVSQGKMPCSSVAKPPSWLYGAVFQTSTSVGVT